jgi:cytochrome c biogenesis protein CcmG/thiol:disulfide interchange protein DsbE
MGVEPGGGAIVNDWRWRLVEVAARALDGDERDAVRGDLAESGSTAGEALREVLGLVARREALRWRDWRPWAALVVIVIPFSLIFCILSRASADASAVGIWMYAKNWEWSFFSNKLFQQDFPRTMLVILLEYLQVACGAWIGGMVLGTMARGRTALNGILLFLLVVVWDLAGVPRVRGFYARDYFGHVAVFADWFYRLMLPPLVQLVLVVLPGIWGIRAGARVGWNRTLAMFAGMATMAMLAGEILIWLQIMGRPARWAMRLPLMVYWPVLYWGMNAVARKVRHLPLFLLALAGAMTAAGQTGVSVALQPPAGRKPAPEIALKDSAGKIARLQRYRGKVVLLDFWATWCHGCKEEIPWFVEMDRKYSKKGLRVVGVSLDDDGWKVVKPFLATARIPYRIVLGDKMTIKDYGIGNMPDTFLIDRQGKIAAAYVGVVDRQNIEANVVAMLAGR